MLEGDIKKINQYKPCIGITQTLIKKTKTFKNNYKFKSFGCDGKSSDKTNKSKHHKCYKLDGAAKATYMKSQKDTWVRMNTFYMSQYS